MTECDSAEGPKVATRSVEVFAVSERHLGRTGANSFSVRLIARGTGTEMYRSSKKASLAEAVELAKQYLRRNAATMVDTTGLYSAPDWWPAAPVV